MEENWKDIKGFNGIYQASNLGRIKSLNRSIIRSNGRRQTFRERILIPGKGKNGYLVVALSCKESGPVTFCVHRLIIESFMVNTENKIDVNHIDSNKLNNNLNNLEYATRSENMKHAYNTGGCIPKNKGKKRVALKIIDSGRYIWKY